MAGTGAVYLIVAEAGTLYPTDWNLAPETKFGAVFASWVGGVALFVVVGAVVAIVSLVRPEDEPFDSRARILFRRQTGAHIDYIVQRIREVLEHYAEEVKRTVSIKKYDGSANLFLVVMQTDSLVRSYIDDTKSSYTSELVASGHADIPKDRQHCLEYLKVGGRLQAEAEYFQDEITRPFKTELESGSVCKVESRLEMWTLVDKEAHRFRPKRYTQKLTLVLENLLSDPVRVKFDTDREEVIPPKGIRTLLEIRDIQPTEKAYEFFIGKELTVSGPGAILNATRSGETSMQRPDETGV